MSSVAGRGPRRWRAMAGGLAGALGLAAIGACATGTPHTASPPAAPPSAPAPAAPPGSLVPAARAEPPRAPRFDPGSPASPLEDPRLVAARDAEARGGHVEAARLVDAELARATDLDAATRARWALLGAVLRREGGDPAGALAAFDRVASSSELLAPAARLEIAALALSLGRHPAALAALEAIPAADRTNPRFAMLHAEALVRAGDAERGAEVLEAWIDRGARPPGWAPVALRVLGALTTRPGEARALAAARIARKVLGAANGSSATEAHARWRGAPSTRSPAIVATRWRAARSVRASTSRAPSSAGARPGPRSPRSIV